MHRVNIAARTAVLLLGTVVGSEAALAATCQDISISANTEARYPAIREYCQGITTKDGKDYMRLNATVVAPYSKSTGEIKVKFKSGVTSGYSNPITLTPPEGFKIKLESRTESLSALNKGDSMEIMLVATEPELVSFDDSAVSEPLPAADVAPAVVPAAEPEPAALPKTASSLPFVALLGAFVLLLASGLGYIRRRRSGTGV